MSVNAAEKFSIKILSDSYAQQEVAVNEAIEPSHFCGAVTFSSSSACPVAMRQLLEETAKTFERNLSPVIATKGWFQRVPTRPSAMRCSLRGDGGRYFEETSRYGEGVR